MIWLVIFWWLLGTGLTHANLPLQNVNSYPHRALISGSKALVYDPENRLIASAVSNQATTFGYEANGTRLWKQGASTNTLQVWIDGNYEEKDGKILYHVSAGDRMVCTFDKSNTVFEYYHPDHLHSAEVLSTGSGGLSQHYEYTAYGNGRYTYSTTAFPVTRRYTSQPFDEETGLYYYGNARYYDPVLGRFIQPDTLIPNIFDPQAYDRYAYALDNPLLYVDPDGHAPWYFYIPGIGPGIAQAQGTFALNAQAQRANYENYNIMAAQLGIGQSSPTAGDVSAVNGAKDIAAAAANAYTTIGPDLATMGMATAPALLGKIGQAAEEGAVETSAANATKGASMVEKGKAGVAASRAAAEGTVPTLGSLTPSQARTIQAFSDRFGAEVNVVGSRAAGTAGPLSDFDYVIGGNSSLRNSAGYYLPRGAAGGELRGGLESGIDIFNANKTPLDPTRPFIQFTPGNAPVVGPH